MYFTWLHSPACLIVCTSNPSATFSIQNINSCNDRRKIERKRKLFRVTPQALSPSPPLQNEAAPINCFPEWWNVQLATYTTQDCSLVEYMPVINNLTSSSLFPSAYQIKYVLFFFLLVFFLHSSGILFGKHMRRDPLNQPPTVCPLVYSMHTSS